VITGHVFLSGSAACYAYIDNLQKDNRLIRHAYRKSIR